MRSLKEYGKVLQIGLIAIVTMTIINVAVFYFFGKWEKRLIQECKDICTYYAGY